MAPPRMMGWIAATFILLAAPVYAHVGEETELQLWFRSLHNGRGTPCCGYADGYLVLDSDWKSANGHYVVRIDGSWVDVPDDAVITTPNLFKRTMVWPIRMWSDEGYQGTSIHCFMPGPLG